jgi:hypothetical protein
MNSSNISSYTYYSLDEILTSVGSNWFLDNLNLYPLTLISIVGLILKIISFVVFLDKEFTIPLYAYLKVFSINNTLLCLVCVINFTATTHRIFEWSNTWWAQVYYNYVFILFEALFYCYGGFIVHLNVVIMLDRISFFNRRVQALLKLLPYSISAISFVICFIVNVPSFFAFAPISRSVKLGQNTTFTVWFIFPMNSACPKQTPCTRFSTLRSETFSYCLSRLEPTSHRSTISESILIKNRT